ncbi:MAG: M23 family metallopeptidase [Actinomycetota bacterium]|nr:M23 family metallopeptidase [Actinomycetota bacterium]
MVRVVFGACALLVGGLLAIPIVIAGGEATDATSCPNTIAITGDVTTALATIRTLESGGRYDARSPGSSASGAYQYIDTTWRSWANQVGVDTAQYPRAYLAPPTVQDAVAAANVTAILKTYHGEVAMIPVYWYYPAAAHDPALMDQVPHPEAGNRLTVRDYQTRWLATYQRIATGHALIVGKPDVNACLPSPATTDGYALPIDRALIDRQPAMLSRPHHDYPAVDLPVPTGTTVYAIHAGTIEAITNDNSNCFLNPCTEACGNGVVIDGTDHARYTYCHASVLHVRAGQHVTAGTLVMTSGNTGRSTGPHLHVGITAAGTKRCPQQLLETIYRTGHGIDPARLPTSGCTD